MANRMERAVPGRLHVLFNVGTFRDLTDGQLLERFSTDGGEAGELAFAALVERHGPMVLRVCRALLRDAHEADDAFQAAFLILARKAGSLWTRDSIGPWLHQVAYRTASNARSSEARRKRHERRAGALTPEDRVGLDGELVRMIHEEIDRLPERFRSPLVLCDLQGRTGEQAARHLGWPIGTIKSRLSRARRRLRDRLVRRGLSPGEGLLVATSGPGLADAPVLAALAETTTRAAVQFAATRATVGGIAALLAKEGLRAMAMTRALKVASMLLALGATVSGAGFLSRTGASTEEPGQGATLPKGERGDDAPTFEVRPGKLRVDMIERGSLEADQGASVLNEVEDQTTVVSILPEGTRVKRGDVVCELDSAALRDKLIAQEIPSKKAKSDLKEVQMEWEVAGLELRAFQQGVFPLQEKASQGRIALAQAELALSQLRAEKVDREAKDDAVAKAEARIGVLRAEQAFRQAEEERHLLREYARGKEVSRLEAQVAKFDLRLPALEAAVRLEESREAVLRKQVEKCTLRAPADGMVVYAGPTIEEGAAVRPRQRLFNIFDPAGPMRVNTKVHEAVVDRLSPGMRARIKVDAFPDQVFSGTVKTIAGVPDPHRLPTQAVKVYTTLVALDQGLPELRPGMTAEVEILVAELDDVLSVPVQAVLLLDGKEQVAVRKPGGGFDWREVALGKTNERVVEVREGVTSGESIALDPISLLSEAEKRQRHLGEPAKRDPSHPRKKS